MEPGELVQADRDRQDADHAHDVEVAPDGPKVLPPRAAVRDGVRPQAEQEEQRKNRARPMVRGRGGERPLRVHVDEVEVRARGEREPHALDGAEAERAPPHRAFGPEPVGGEARQIGDGSLPHPSSSLLPFGQNQPISVIATSAPPQTTAHGLKIDATKVIPVAIAARKGQIDGSGEGSRSSARASVTVLAINSRLSTLRPVTTERLSRSAQSGSRLVTNGMRSKLCGGGGEAVAHSSVPAPHGLSPAIAPTRM